MAIEIPDLSVYDILELADGMEIKIPLNMFSFGPDQVRVYVFPEDRTLEDLEAIFQNAKLTYQLHFWDREKENMYANLRGYTILLNLEKKYQEAYRKEYDENGEYQIYTTDLFVVTLKKPDAEDMLPQFQANLEYIAIMSDIDIDDDII